MQNPTIFITITKEQREFIDTEHIKAAPYIRDLVTNSKLFQDWQLKKQTCEAKNGRR